ncbi:hypothetical protein C1X05_08420 [Laceyella sacchari]|uniref:Uncharacterized protein n=1 Tax=Laceyella tengchongensis TaxID=574699 RepID=A0AA45WNJ4_9BACL|nr:hypothetical protein C1X05_08420 [Laceyella sacchari]SMP18766.1 hypothetical protein SAMN06265361_103201 [Laceyella tengchongensis]
MSSIALCPPLLRYPFPQAYHAAIDSNKLSIVLFSFLTTSTNLYVRLPGKFGDLDILLYTIRQVVFSGIMERKQVDQT